MIHIRSVSVLLQDVQKSFENQEHVSVKDIVDAFHERGFGFFLFLFALPAALPIPAVGLGTVMALPLLFLSIQFAYGRSSIWLPKRILAYRIEKSNFSDWIDKTIPWSKRIETLIKPRLSFITQGIVSRIFSLLGLIMALSVFFPLPLTNTVPSIGIAIMGLGIMMRDGIAVIAGAFIGIAWITLLMCAIFIFGPEAFEIIKNTIRHVFYA